MTDDQTTRLIAKIVFFSILLAFKPQIIRLAYRLGYREGPGETGWKRGAKVVGIGFAITALLIIIA